jgi:competence protein ComEA
VPDKEPYVTVAPPVLPRDGGEVWPCAARRMTALLAVAAVALLAWRGYGLSRWSLRPAPISREDWISPIDLNQALRADLRTIPGIGEKLADRIVAHRDANGPFTSLDELRLISGIGPATLTRLRPHLRIDPPPTVRGARPDGKDSPIGRKVTPATKVDLNRATAEQLRAIPGVGPTLTTRILDARRDKPFRAIDDLRRVKGIGAKTLEKLRPFIEVK